MVELDIVTNVISTLIECTIYGNFKCILEI